MYDLHLHSTYSDGIVNINDIVNAINMIGIEGFSITDHDNIEGVNLSESLSRKYNLDFISGIEFGITYKGKEIHILGYFIDIKNSNILNLIKLAKEDRINRTNKIINKLNSLGIKVNIDELKNYSKKDIISRSHFANLLVNKGYCKSIKEAFSKYLDYSGLAYVSKNFAKPYEIIRTIKDTGGVSILAHPSTINNDEIVKEIIYFGIDGLEIINSKHALSDIIKYYDLANQFKLIKTSGSDCHGKLISKYKYIGRYTQNKKNINNIKNLHEFRINGI
ncbi:PHP domain-containing protein [Miniphocaeibacter massiliensis]|uniref:PHP domain-containing protein n=1 Tax=Miniphocaeibacter massiliensis TaxID=2041841 RepID=UPI0013ED80AD|nr:PHP domain-containing protein [Miniphocaeibacter massiliensis]